MRVENDLFGFCVWIFCFEREFYRFIRGGSFGYIVVGLGLVFLFGIIVV